MVIEDSFELFTCAFHIRKVDPYWCCLHVLDFRYCHYLLVGLVVAML